MIKEDTLYFRDEVHRVCYENALAETKTSDTCSKVAIYLLTSTPETRDYFYDIYDPEKRAIRPDCWREPWRSPMTKLIISAALSLSGSPQALAAASGTIWPVRAYDRIDQMDPCAA